MSSQATRELLACEGSLEARAQCDPDMQPAFEVWDLLGSLTGTADERLTQLERTLAEFSQERLALFHAVLTGYASALHREDLWCAAYILRGGCSDDSYEAFLGWLLLQGPRTVHAAVTRPASLVEVDPSQPVTRGGVYFAAAHLFWKRCGKEDFEAQSAALTAAAPTSLALPLIRCWPPDRISHGQEWTPDLQAQHFPALVLRFRGHEVFWSARRARRAVEFDAIVRHPEFGEGRVTADRPRATHVTVRFLDLAERDVQRDSLAVVSSPHREE